MVFRALDPEFVTQLRRREVDKLKYTSAFQQVIAREVVPPTFKYEWDAIDDAIKVTKSETGKAGPRSIIGIDRLSTGMNFYMAEMDFPWVDEWMVANRSPGTLPTTIQSYVNPARAASVMMDDVLRSMDTDFVDQLLALDASPNSIGAADVTTAEGRQAFLETLALVIGEASETLVTGEKVLFIDDKALAFLGLPFVYTDGTGTGAGTSTVREIMDGFNVRIVASQNPALNGKAVLHYRELDNLSFLHSTPSGVQVLWGQNGDNKTLRVFHHAGLAELRDNAVVKHSSVISDLF